MTWEEYGQEKYDEGYDRGYNEGYRKAVVSFAISLIADGTLTIGEAAKKLNTSEEELKKVIDSFGESNAEALPVKDQRNMSGHWKNYKAYMSQEYIPIDFESIPYGLDIEGLKAYAKEKGVAINDLTKEEKEQFVFLRKNQK